MKIADIKKLADGVIIPEVIFKVNKSYPDREKDRWGNVDKFCLTEDSSEKSAVRFKTKKKLEFNFQEGKTYRATAGKKGDGTLCGLRWTAKDRGCIEITDAGNIEEYSGSVGSAPSGQSSSKPQSQVQSTEDPTEFIQHFGKTYLKIEEILSPIMGDKMRPELITSCMIQCERKGIVVVQPPKETWRNVLVKGKKLGDMNKDELKPIVLLRAEKPFNNNILNEQFVEILTAAGYNGSMFFAEASRKRGFEQETDAVDTVLLRDFKTSEDMSQDQMIEAALNEEFWSNVKNFIEERASSANAESGAATVEDL